MHYMLLMIENSMTRLDKKLSILRRKVYIQGAEQDDLKYGNKIQRGNLGRAV
jgi:hypothetical protein